MLRKLTLALSVVLVVDVIAIMVAGSISMSPNRGPLNFVSVFLVSAFLLLVAAIGVAVVILAAQYGSGRYR